MVTEKRSRRTAERAVIVAVVLSLAMVGPAACRRAARPGLTVSAAASLRTALTEAAEAYKTTHPGVSLALNFASSGTLKEQIIHGAPVDLFISAGAREMDALAVRGLIDVGSRRDLIGNRLVLITAKTSTSPLKDWPDLTGPGVRRLAIGFPDTVPAGEYGKQVLEALGLWTALQDRLVQAKDVTQVLTYVKTGDVDAGIVYASDARDPAVRVVAEAPPGSHQPVVYPAAVVKASRQTRESRAFLDFLAGPKGQAIFAEYGFEPKSD